MRFNVKALALACAILWGGAVLAVTLVNVALPNFGQQFLEMMASCYPGYHPNHTVISAVVGALYAAADGLIGGAVFGWLYNGLTKVSA